MALNIITS